METPTNETPQQRNFRITEARIKHLWEVFDAQTQKWKQANLALVALAESIPATGLVLEQKYDDLIKSHYAIKDLLEKQIAMYKAEMEATNAEIEKLELQ